MAKIPPATISANTTRTTISAAGLTASSAITRLVCPRMCRPRRCLKWRTVPLSELVPGGDREPRDGTRSGTYEAFHGKYRTGRGGTAGCTGRGHCSPSIEQPDGRRGTEGGSAAQLLLLRERRHAALDRDMRQGGQRRLHPPRRNRTGPGAELHDSGRTADP